MESGFSLAGPSIADRRQRARTVRPSEDSAHRLLQPISKEMSGDLEGDVNGDYDGMFYPDHLDKGMDGGEQENIEQFNQKHQQLKNQIEEQLDDEHGKAYKQPFVVNTPPQPTREEFERRQTTHTPYAPWCRHCLAARAVRSQHPSKGRKAIVVPDIDTGNGPTKVSMDYMYLHERKGKYKETTHNPPHMVMIEHTKGRCWAHRVPNKGILDEAHWLPERMIQDLDNAGMRHTKIPLKSDQEPAIVSVQQVVQDTRPEVIPTNTPVGGNLSVMGAWEIPSAGSRRRSEY